MSRDLMLLRATPEPAATTEENRGEPTMSDHPYVTSTATICDGTVIRWFTSEAAMRHCNPVVSASRNGVMGGDRYITSDLFVAAWDAHLALKDGEDVSHLATHRSKHLLGDEYVPIERAPEGAA